jgi:hypothetical protein
MSLSAGARAEFQPLAPAVPPRRPNVALAFGGAVAIGAVVTGLVFRFVAAGPLWLDEAQSVAIARRPLPQLFSLLRHDGSPPLYYLLLHWWIDVFGTGTFAVRALSGVLAVVALPLVFALASRLVDRALGLVAVFVLAVSPFAIRYATEARMYSLVLVLVALGGIALLATVRGASLPAAAGLGLVTATLLLTHYWAYFLVAVTAAALLPRALRRSRGHLLAVGGLAAGLLPVLPWLPTLLFQLRHTGTPWSHPKWGDAVMVRDWAGGTGRPATVLAILLLALAAAGLVGRTRTASVGRRALAFTVVTLAVAIVTSKLTGGALVSRYTAVALVPFVVAVACGVRAGRPNRVALAVALLGVAILGLYRSALAAAAPRSSADKVAAALMTADPARDVAVFCPDQLGPDTYRLVTNGLPMVTYPSGASAEWVDWVDYTYRMQHEQPDAYAARLAARVPPGGAVWVVTEFHDPAYPGSCGPLLPYLAGRFGLPSAESTEPGLSGGRIQVLRYTKPAPP